MMHIRVYRVLDAVTVEWSCNHGDDGDGVQAHLLYRETRQEHTGQPEHLALLTSELVATAALLAWEDHLPGLTDECGW